MIQPCEGMTTGKPGPGHRHKMLSPHDAADGDRPAGAWPCSSDEKRGILITFSFAGRQTPPCWRLDRAEIVSFSEELETPAGKFAKCLKTKETSALESGAEYKLYAPGVGLLKDGDMVLVKVEKPKTEAKEGPKNIEHANAPAAD